ncbi:TatD family hydrolase [Butyrivibrio sp. FCS014]|uniref:TatD family hydrolase n=1 Tax=Butyrivibrio sp. FCS014 TaxID=1408304 RepID=UPI000467BE6C|nr:TatD family hydrolase [Butyrivibrio sp. FCS014]
MIFDTHAHYDDEAFDEDRIQLLDSMKEAGIGTIVNIGANMASSRGSLKLAHEYDFIYAAVGVHPSDCAELDDGKMLELKELSADERCVAIGEIGLDYYWPEPDRDLQKMWFRKQIALAKGVKLPVVIHSRDAAADTLAILKEENAGVNGGVVHCFSYSAEVAKQCVDMGFFIGVGGVVTFKNGRKLKETVDILPLDNIIIETDAPYLAPAPHRGERNCSLYLPLVVETIADIKGVSTEEVIRITEENAKRMYNIAS